MSAEIDLEWLLSLMPQAEAALYRVLIGLIPAPSAEAPNLARRQIKMELLANLTDFTKRWVIELLPRLEEKNLIRTEGGSGTVKWIWRLPLGAPRLGRSYPTELTQKKKTSPVKAKAPWVAASQPTRRRKETAQSTKPDAGMKVQLPVEKPVEIPARRREVPMPSIPPDNPAADNPALLATMVIPPPDAPTDPPLPATMMPPPPPSTAPGGLAAGNPMVRATTVPPPPPLAAPGVPAPSNPVVPAAPVKPPSSGAPPIPAKPIPPAPLPRPGTPIKDLVAYVCSLPVTSDLICSLKTAVGNEHRLRIALEILCQRRHRYAQESNLKSAIRSALNDYL